MPTVSCDRDYLFKLIGREFTKEEFDDLCFKYGIELDDVVEEEGKIVYKIEVGANRYDLLCVEGIAICLKAFLGLAPFPTFTTKPSGIQVIVENEVSKVRPIGMGAVLRGVTFTDESYKSFIDFLDKLHLTIGKRRNLVSIGTHDLDTIQAPFRYVARKPEDIKFVPLKCDKEMTGNEVLAHFANDLKLREYATFRHFYRHAYSFQLNWEKMKPLVYNVFDVWSAVKKSLKNLILREELYVPRR